MYLDVVLSLTKIEESQNGIPELRAKVRPLKEALLKFETIMTAHVYLRIFQLTTPLSKYLQTTGIDLLKVHQLVMGTLQQLVSIQRDFDKVKLTVAKFIDWVADELDRRVSENNIILQDAFTAKRTRKEKKDAR